MVAIGYDISAGNSLLWPHSMVDLQLCSNNGDHVRDHERMGALCNHLPFGLIQRLARCASFSHLSDLDSSAGDRETSRVVLGHSGGG